MGYIQPTTCFGNKVLLENNFLLHVFYGCFCATMAELSDCNRYHMASQRLKYYLAFYRKSLPTMSKTSVCLELSSPEAPPNPMYFMLLPRVYLWLVSALLSKQPEQGHMFLRASGAHLPSMKSIVAPY